MSRKQGYSEDEVIRILRKKKSISFINKTIEVFKFADDLGNKSWGKIDFLTNHCGYYLSIVTHFSKS